MSVDVTVTNGQQSLLVTVNQGPIGPQGPQGERGEKGDTGDTGPAGAGGPQGEKGDTGAAGTDGVSIVSVELTDGNHQPGELDTYTITYSSGGTSTFQVYNGLNGTYIYSVDNGLPPLDSVGNDGDWAFDTSVHAYVWRKWANTWGSPVNSLRGPEGPQGIQGPEGPMGPGTGDVTGPGSSVAGNFAVFADETGIVIADGGTPGSMTFEDTTSYYTTGDIDLTVDTLETAISGKENFHGVESYGTIDFDDLTQTLSVASIKYWYKGVSFTSLVPITATIPTPVADTLYFFYCSDATGTITISTSPWSIIDDVLLATVTWNGSTGAVINEMHGYTRDLDWHDNAHNTIGTRYQSGLAQTYPSTAVDDQISISGGKIWDEDIQTDIGAQTTARIWYNNGAGKYTFDTTPSTRPYKWNAATSRVQYFDTDTLTLTDLGTSQFTVVWVYATPDIDVPIWILVADHAEPYANLTTARTAPVPSLSGQPVTPETKLIYRWIFRGDGEYQEATDYRQSSSLPAGGTPATSASSVTFTPTGNVSATNVQSAIAEVDTEKLGYSATTTTTATYGTAALPATPAGFITVDVNGTPYKIPFYNL